MENKVVKKNNRLFSKNPRNSAIFMIWELEIIWKWIGRNREKMSAFVFWIRSKLLPHHLIKYYIQVQNQKTSNIKHKASRLDVKLKLEISHRESLCSEKQSLVLKAPISLIDVHHYEKIFLSPISSCLQFAKTIKMRVITPIFETFGIGNES